MYPRTVLISQQWLVDDFSHRQSATGTINHHQQSAIALHCIYSFLLFFTLAFLAASAYQHQFSSSITIPIPTLTEMEERATKRRRILQTVGGMFPFADKEVIESTVNQAEANLAAARGIAQEAIYDTLDSEVKDKAIALYATELNAKNVELNAENVEVNAKNVELNAENVELNAENVEFKKNTLQGLINLDVAASNQYKLVCAGKKSSHVNTGHDAATPSQADFPLKTIRLHPDTAKRMSMVMGTLTNHKTTYSNEYDVQCFVHNALLDAVVICNDGLKKQQEDNNNGNPNRKVKELSVRREAGLFSNKLDHSVVFDVLSGDSLFSVETKKPLLPETKTLVGEKKVIGQVFDQLASSKACGHPNPFGAVTTFDKTHICWIDTDTSGDVIEKHKGEQDLFDLPPLDPTNEQDDDDQEQAPATQSPIQMRSPNAQQCSRRKTRSGGFKAATREVYVSKAFEMHELVPALVNAINCSLTGYKKAKSVEKLVQGCSFNRFALKLTKDAYTWGSLPITYQGALTKKPETLYLIDFLASGSTSKVYRAVTIDGRDCVVKMYVRKVDDEGRLIDKRVYERNAKGAVKREVANFKLIYPKMKGVSACVLNDMHCVIHPFFEHPAENERLNLLGEIDAHLQKYFVLKKKRFAKSDQCWRHVGRHEGALVLFDLADLEELPPAEIQTYAGAHRAYLNDKIPR